MLQNWVESIRYHLNSMPANFGAHCPSRMVTVTIFRDHFGRGNIFVSFENGLRTGVSGRVR